MPKVLSDDEWTQLLSERDPFRLTIRGVAAIEGVLDDAIERAFEGRAREEDLQIPLKRKLRLAVALGLVTPDAAAALRALVNLRNDFAHGREHELSLARARQLADAYRPAAGDLKLPDDPLSILYTVVLISRIWVVYGADFVLRRREEERRFLYEHEHSEEFKELILEAMRRRAQEEYP